MRTIHCLVVGLVVATAATAQDYEIVDRAGRVMATAWIQRGQLTVVESTGERVSFQRDARYDSADRSFVGFLNFKLQRVLRFPRSGRGVMQIADLDVPKPQFRNTLRTVRAAEVDRLFRYAPEQIAGGWPSPYQTGSYPYASGFRSALALPRSVLIDSKTTANPPLPSVKLTLINSGPREVLVTVVDAKTNQPKEIRIRPSQQTGITVERDAGATRVQQYQTISIHGDVATKQVTTQISPAVRYEFIVHEWVMQSIAIDRTGTSPSPIEDINYQGKGLGRFSLPPGAQLQSGTLDVYRAAKSAQNRSTVAPITAQEKQLGDGLSPLERAVLELQQKR